MLHELHNLYKGAHHSSCGGYSAGDATRPPTYQRAIREREQLGVDLPTITCPRHPDVQQAGSKVAVGWSAVSVHKRLRNRCCTQDSDSNARNALTPSCVTNTAASQHTRHSSLLRGERESVCVRVQRKCRGTPLSMSLATSPLQQLRTAHFHNVSEHCKTATATWASAERTPRHAKHRPREYGATRDS